MRLKVPFLEFTGNSSALKIPETLRIVVRFYPFTNLAFRLAKTTFFANLNFLFHFYVGTLIRFIWFQYKQFFGNSRFENVGPRIITP